jgi:hypothetical protein
MKMTPETHPPSRECKESQFSHALVKKQAEETRIKSAQRPQSGEAALNRVLPQRESRVRQTSSLCHGTGFALLASLWLIAIPRHACLRSRILALRLASRC